MTPAAVLVRDFVLAPSVLGSFPAFPASLCARESDFFGVSRPLPSSPCLRSGRSGAQDIRHVAPLLPRRGTDEIGVTIRCSQQNLPCGQPCTPGPHVIPSSQNWCSKKIVLRFHDGRRLFIQCHFLTRLVSRSDFLNPEVTNHRSRRL